MNLTFSESQFHQNTEDLYDQYRICVGGDVGGQITGFVHLASRSFRDNLQQAFNSIIKIGHIVAFGP